MDAINIARTGLQAGGSATSSGAGPVDVASALVDQLVAKQDVLANLSVIKTVSKLEQNTIERWG